MERLNKPNMESLNSEASMDLIVSRAKAEFNKGQNQEIIHEKKTFKNSVKDVFKKITTVGLAATIAAGTAGCADRMITPDTSGDIIPTSVQDTVTPSETSETSVKVDPVGTTETVATPTPVETTAAPVETDVNAELAAAPEISGLSKEIQDEKVVYKAVEGNEYGIEVGKYAGEYNPNVFVDGEKIGCVNLIPIAAEKILNDQLAKIPEDELKFKILLPVEGDQVVNSEINVIFEDDFYGNKMMVINSEDNMNVYNICPNSDWFFRGPFDYKGSKLVTIINSSIKLTTYKNPNKMLNENAMYFLQTTVTANEDFNSQDLFQSSFGEIFTQSNEKEVSIGLADENGTYDVLIEDIVKTDDGVLIGTTSEK